MTNFDIYRRIEARRQRLNGLLRSLDLDHQGGGHVRTPSGQEMTLPAGLKRRMHNYIYARRGDSRRLGREIAMFIEKALHDASYRDAVAGW